MIEKLWSLTSNQAAIFEAEYLTASDLFHISAVWNSDTGMRWETGQSLNYDGMNLYFQLIDTLAADRCTALSTVIFWENIMVVGSVRL